MTREELIAYDKWLTRRKWGTGEIISPEKAADLYLAEQPLPPAEGAEEILDGMDLGEPIQTGEFYYRSEVLEAMNKFATLHAQRLAEKMVSDKLRKEYERGIEDGKIIGKHGSVSYIE